MEINVITLEDGKDYMIIETIVNGNDKYLFLANENDRTDMCVRKVINKDGKEYITKLDSENEFNEVMISLYSKYKGE